MTTSPIAFVDLDAVARNYRFLCGKAGAAKVGAAVKANAYGLGAGPVAQALYGAGCRTFFTAHFSEAVEVQGLLSDAVICVLHGIDEADYREAVAKNIVPTINHLGALEAWSRFARQVGRLLPAFIHLDTGMNRLGLSPNEQQRLIENQSLLSGIHVAAWISHFACADEFDKPMTKAQREKFLAVVRGLPPAPKSLCNSSGIFWGGDYLFDLARPGIALYGGNPTPHKSNPMRAVLELQTPILQVRQVDDLMTVGYGASHVVKRKGRVATVALGYADGYHRALSNRGAAMIGDYRVPLIGRVSMDLITLDVTEVPEDVAHVGAMATLIGPHRTIDAIAAEAGTIPYEILTSLGPRVERVYRTDSAVSKAIIA